MPRDSVGGGPCRNICKHSYQIRGLRKTRSEHFSPAHSPTSLLFPVTGTYFRSDGELDSCCLSASYPHREPPSTSSSPQGLKAPHPAMLIETPHNSAVCSMQVPGADNPWLKTLTLSSPISVPQVSALTLSVCPLIPLYLRRRR